MEYETVFLAADIVVLVLVSALAWYKNVCQRSTASWDVRILSLLLASAMLVNTITQYQFVSLLIEVGK